MPNWLKLRAYENSVADSCTSESSKNQHSLLKKKAYGKVFRSADVQKSVREFSYGHDLRQFYFFQAYTP